MLPSLPEEHLAGRTVIRIDGDWPEIARQPDHRPTSPVTPDHLAYVIYTSGSTGQSKGVMVTHRNWLNAYYAWEDAYGLHPGQSHLQMANFSFDVFSGDFVRALGSGGKLVLAPRDLLLSAPDLHRLMVEEQVSVAEFVPPVLRNLVQHLQEERDDLTFMEVLVCASDSWFVDEYQRFRRFCGPNTRLINSYGLTETTIDTTWFESERLHLAGEQVVPIGRPFANQRVYILDSRLQPVPIGVPGEIFIGGAGVARGYLHRPHHTAERFLPDPFGGQPGARLYRTGDRARFLPGGDIEFLGRVDFQIKIRGFRIEPGEIESVLGKHPGLKETAVVVVDDPAGNKRIVAYVSPVRQPAPTPSELRRYLLERLPEYMVPSAFVILDALPLTPNGKLDRRRLPEPRWDERISEQEFVAPRTPIEEILLGIWQEVLGISHISVLDDFFELGGHSLLATQLMSRIRAAFEIELPLRNIFENSTIATLAEAVDIAQRSASGVLPPPILPAPHDGPQPVSFAQQRLWFLDQLEPNSPYYNIPEGMRVRGPLDVAVLERCLNEEVRRHESLRTTFDTVDGKPVQIIHPHLTLHIPIVDLSHLSEEKREAEVLRWAREEARTPFVLSEGPLLRMKVLHLADDDHVILTTMHHIISDEWSSNVLTQEIAVLYDAFSHGRPSPLPDLPIQYVDFARWQREWLQGEVLEAQLAYWRKQLVGAPALLELPTDRPRPPIQAYAGDYQIFRLSPSLSAGIKELCQREGVTLFMALLAAFDTLLYRYSGQDDISVGTPIANRTRDELEGIIGFFVNTLVLRTKLDGEPTFREVLQRVREMSLGAYAHQDIPFEMLVDAVQPERDLSHSPLFQVMFVIQNAKPGESRVMSDLLLTPLEAHSGTAKFDLTLFMLDEPDGLSGAMEYNTDLFGAATIERMLAHFQNLLSAIIADPDQPISRLPLLSEAERRYLLVEWNQTDFPYPADLCVHQLVEAQVQRTPDAVAVSDGKQTMTYAQLNARANQLAHHLRSLGVGPDALVGVLMHRTPDVVVALLGSLKSGGAYLPIDPTYPPERIRYMIEDAGISVLLTDENIRGEDLWPEITQSAISNTQILSLDDPVIDSQPTANPAPLAAPDDLAYVIYTSGSTGRPKGVMLDHRNVVNYLTWCQRAYPLEQGAGSPVHSSISFDLTVTSMFSPLVSGGVVRLVPEEAGVEGLGDAMLESDGFSLVKLTPAHLELLSHQIPSERAASCTRAFIIGGEALMPGHIAFWQEHAPGVELVNEYGPTETAVGCCVYTAPPDLRYAYSVPIGRPIINTRLYVLDKYFQPVPIGVPGELYISGAGVCRGYFNRPELTAERFLLDPFSETPGQRMYRTGDLVRHTTSGELEFLGRLDHQVKVRGFRIELGEIEANLAEHPGVQDAVVLAREDTPGQKRLVAYVRPVADAEIRPAELRDFLQDRLPEYMIPSVFVVMESFPLTPNAKVDRKALPAPEVSREDLEKPYVAPRTPMERFLAEQFMEVLGVERVGIHDNFFELGGDSLLAATFINRLQERFQETTRVRSIFLAPTVAELAYYLQEYYPAIVAKITEGVDGEIPDELRRDLTHATTVIDADVVAEFQRLLPALPKERVEEPEAKNPPAVFILSPPRSGSTLLRVMLAGHPNLFAPPELDLLSFHSMDQRRRAFRGRYEFWLEGAIKAVAEARGIPATEAERLLREYESQGMSTKAFYALLQEWIGDRLLVDKTPVYSLNLDVLRRVEADFENARCIHLVRNPYATIYSFIEAKLDRLFCRFEHPYSRRELAELAWIASHQNILAFLDDVPAERHQRLYYEELVSQPEAQMQSLSEFLGIPYDPNMIRPYLGDRMTSGLKPGKQMVGDFKFYLHKDIDPRSANRWRRRHVGNFLSGLGVDLARELGYSEADLFVPPAGSSSAWIPIQPAPRDGDLPLSFAQQRLWFLEQLEPGNPFYNMPTAVRLQGALDVPALSAALNEIVRRHETLRTSIITEEGKARQIIAPHVDVDLPLTDLTHLSADEREQQARVLAAQEAETPFYLEQGPLFCGRLLKLAEDDHVLLLTLHHIISDGWSMRVLVHELATLYQAFNNGQPSPLPELPIQYADFAYWQRQWLQGEVLEAQL
ncbi:MAG TPA: amino acid adenylation domain-containing protein, partial [Caldilineae bacterium]|nr:amino acid adenylation domain-containing protein [Caldilineae bacterium]